MPLGDFTVSGEILAETNLDDVLGEISKELQKATGNMQIAEEAADDFDDQLLAMSGGLELTEEQLEDVNAELGKLGPQTQSAMAGLASLNAAQVGPMSPVGGLMDDKEGMQHIVARDFFDSDVFRRLTREQFDISDESFGGITSQIKRGNISNIDELTKSLQKASDETISQSEATRRLSRAAKVAKADIDDLVQRGLREHATAAKTAEVSTDDLISSFQKASINAEGLEATLTDTKGEFNGLSASIAQADGSLEVFSAIAKHTEDNVEEAADQIGGLSNRFHRLTASALSANTALGFTILSMGILEDEAEEAGRDIDELTDALGRLLPRLKTVSANIGPFNIGLANLLVTLPLIITLTSVLVGIITALATAIIGVVAAFGALFAIGALDFAEQLEENFAGITGKAEAFEAIMKGLARAVREAVQPLAQVEFAGLTGAELFVQVLQDLVLMIHTFSEVLASILQMEEVESFLLTLREIMLGINDESGMSALRQFKLLLADIVPVLEAFVVFMANNLGEIFHFARTVTNEMLPALTFLMIALVDLAVNLSQLAGEVLPEVIRMLSLMIFSLSVLIGLIEFIIDALGPLGDLIVVLVVSLSMLLIVSAKVISSFMFMIETIAVASEVIVLFSSEVGGASGALASFRSAILGVSSATLKMVGAFALATGALLILADEIDIPMLSEELEDLAAAIALVAAAAMRGYGAFGLLGVGILMIEGKIDVLPGKLDKVAGALITAGTAGYYLYGALQSINVLTKAKFVASVLGASGALLKLAATEVITAIATHGLTKAVYGLVASLITLQTLTVIGVLITLAGVIIWIAMNMQKTVDIIESFFEWFNNLPGPIKAVLALLLGPFLLSLMFLKELLMFIMNPEETVARWWEDLQEGIQGIEETLFDFFDGIIGYILDTIGWLVDMVKWIEDRLPGEDQEMSPQTRRRFNQSGADWISKLIHIPMLGATDQVMQASSSGSSGRRGQSTQNKFEFNVYTNGEFDERDAQRIKRLVDRTIQQKSERQG